LFLRIFLFLSGITGSILGHHLFSLFFPNLQGTYDLISVLVGVGMGVLISYIIYHFFWTHVEEAFQRATAAELIAGSSGLLFGLVIAGLITLSLPLTELPVLTGILSALFILLFCTGLATTVTLKKKEEFFSFFGSLPKSFEREKYKSNRMNTRITYKVLDTSSIIDGRIADLCQTGFLEGVLIVPGFVLTELQRIADSSDSLKRNRGRRGLDILNKMQKEPYVSIRIYDQDFEDATDVDIKLVRLAKALDAKVITNDYNLNKVAELYGVPVLNINELSNAIKPIILPGEDVLVQVIKDGKEYGQGVAYLEDGTMIVVDGGRQYIGEEIMVGVTSVLQTAAGRMIFAKPKEPVPKPTSSIS